MTLLLSAFDPLIEQCNQSLNVLADNGFKAKSHNPDNLKICPKENGTSV